ncbi:tetratricopeptide repeat protein, partial [Myxococcota bacterium]|nr:tetratricopeptide repeat protein [Myxococcota bacterium]
DCQSRLGSELREKHDIKNAVTAYQKAIQIYSTQKTVAQAYPRRYMGILQENSLNDYKKALDQYTKAREAATLYNKEELRLVLSVDIARVHRRRGSYSEALKELAGIQKSLELASVKLQGEASLEEARVYWYRGSYQRASILQERSLRLAQKAGLTFLEIQSISLAGLIALNQGELESAETFFRSALDLSRITGRRSEEAAQLNNLGIVQREKNENEAALITFERALAIDEELESKEGKAYDLRNIGKTLARAQRYAAALQALNKALGMSRAIGNRYNEVQCLLARGEVLEALKRTPLALQSYQEAAKMGRSLSLPEVEWRALYAEGRINYSNPDLALKKYLESINVAERVARTGASIGEMNRTDLYADAFSLALENNKLSLAFNISERGRGRGLLDILSTSTLDLPPQAQALLSTDLKAREALLAARRTDEKEEVIQALQKAMTDARNKLALEQPLIARAFTISPQSLEELQTTLSPDTLVLNYFVGSDSVILMAIKKESVEFHTILIDAAELEEKIAELGSLMRAFAPLDDELSDLGEVLLGPVSSKLKEAKHIVILPHRWLYSLPFAALEVDETALVDLAPISISPSGSHL